MTAVIVSARFDSKRLPGKAMLRLGGVPCIELLFRRLSGSRKAKELVFATSNRQIDDPLADFVSRLGFPVYRGSADDLVDRYLSAADQFGLRDQIVRVTGDCPFVDHESLDYFLAKAERSEPADIFSTKGRFPVGIDFELFKVDTLRELGRLPDLSLADREHLTLRFYSEKENFRVSYVDPPEDWLKPRRSFTLDTEQDYLFLGELAEGMGDAPVRDILAAAERL